MYVASFEILFLIHLKGVMQWGCDPNFAASKNQAIELSNKNAVGFGVADLLYALLSYLILDDWYMASVFVVSSLLFLGLPLFLAAIGFVDLSRICVTIIGSLLVTVVSFYFGRESQAHISLLLGGITPFLTIKTDEYKLLVIAFLTPILCFICLWYFDFSLGPQFVYRDDSIKDIVFILICLFVYVATFLVIWNSQKMQQAFEKQLMNKNLEVSNLVNVLTHDLANHLTVMIGCHDVIKQKPEKLSLLLPKISKHSQSASQVVDTVKELQAIEQGKAKIELKPININEFVHEFVQDVQELGNRKNIKIQLEGESISWILGHGNILRNQVFMNILTNGIKFSDPGQTVTFSLQDDNYANRVVLRIWDRGVGMPESIRKNIFRNDVITNRQGTKGEKGTGFGLPIAKRFMGMLGGQVKVNSNERNLDSGTHGTEFILYFPIYRETDAAI